MMSEHNGVVMVPSLNDFDNLQQARDIEVFRGEALFWQRAYNMLLIDLDKAKTEAEEFGFGNLHIGGVSFTLVPDSSQLEENDSPIGIMLSTFYSNKADAAEMKQKTKQAQLDADKALLEAKAGIDERKRAVDAGRVEVVGAAVADENKAAAKSDAAESKKAAGKK